jgi:hypothetical protein
MTLELAFRLLWEGCQPERLVPDEAPSVPLHVLRGHMIKLLIPEMPGSPAEQWLLARVSLGPVHKNDLFLWWLLDHPEDKPAHRNRSLDQAMRFCLGHGLVRLCRDGMLESV